jgi:hypothetical protein
LEITVEKSLADLMGEAYATSLDVAYETIAPNGYYLNAREVPVEHSDMVWAWADGGVHAYYERMVTGRCSLQAQIDFDLERFESRVVRELDLMQRILRRLGAPRVLTFEEMQARGYRGAWAGC